MVEPLEVMSTSRRRSPPDHLTFSMMENHTPKVLIGEFLLDLDLISRLRLGFF